MRRKLWALFVGFLLPASAQAVDPLKIIPSDAELVVKIERPRQLLEAGLDRQLIADFLKIEAVRDALDSTQFRRFHQIHTHFEKTLKHGHLDLADKLGGGGMVLAARYFERPAIMAVLEAKDEQLLRQAVQLSLKVLEEELARQEAPSPIKKGKHKDTPIIHVGKQFHVAVVGVNLVASTDLSELHAAIDRIHKGSDSTHAGLAEARKTMPANPLAWAWFSLDSVRKSPGVKTALEQIEANPQTAFALGGLVDIFKNSPFVCLSLSGTAKELELSLRTPVGRSGVSEAAALLLPPDEKGSLPLLEPANVLASISYYLDLGRLWENRQKMLNAQQLKVLEDVDSKSGIFLGGTKMSTLLQQAGAYQRIVVAQQPTACYKTEPKLKIPAFALVVQMRDPAFARSMETVLRVGGLVASTQLQLKMNEEKHEGANIISYRFDETKKLGGDQAGIRFNFSPAFAKVGDQFLLYSTEELCKDLIGLVRQEKEPRYNASSTVMQVYGAGGAALLQAAEEQVLSQAILGQGLSLDAAKEQLRALLEVIERLGSLRLEEHYGIGSFRYDLRWLRK